MSGIVLEIPELPSLRARVQELRTKRDPAPRFAVGTVVEGVTDRPVGLVPRHTDAPVVEAMTADVACVTGDTSVRAVRALFEARGISAAPVVDGRGRPVGFVTLTDLARVARAEVVDDVMTCFAFAVPISATLGRAAALMAYEGVRRCVVVDECGRVAGIISESDIAEWVAERAGYGELLGGGTRT